MARNVTPVWTNTVEHHSNAFTPKGELIYFLHFKRCTGRGLNISTSKKNAYNNTSNVSVPNSFSDWGQEKVRIPWNSQVTSNLKKMYL
jgi:hypothetical protein